MRGIRGICWIQEWVPETLFRWKAQFLGIIDPSTNIQEASWKLMMLHEDSWWWIESTHDVSKILMMRQEYSWFIMSPHEPSRILTTHHECSWWIMSTHGAALCIITHDTSRLFMMHDERPCWSRFVSQGSQPDQYLYVLKRVFVKFEMFWFPPIIFWTRIILHCI